MKQFLGDDSRIYSRFLQNNSSHRKNPPHPLTDSLLKPRRQKPSLLLSQSKLNTLVEKSISDTNVILKQLPDKEFLKFWKLMLQNFGECLTHKNANEIKVLDLYEKVRILEYMVDMRYASVEDIPKLSEHLKYNLYFESFLICKGVPTKEGEAKGSEVRFSPVINSVKTDKKSKRVFGFLKWCLFLLFGY